MDSFTDAPQPKTFAPSREDVLTTLAYFFGAPVSPEKLKNYEEHHAQVRVRALGGPLRCLPTGADDDGR